MSKRNPPPDSPTITPAFAQAAALEAGELFPDAVTPPANGTPAEPVAKKKRGLPGDIQTLARIDRLLCDLEPVETARILDWLVGKYVDTPEPTE